MLHKLVRPCSLLLLLPLCLAQQIQKSPIVNLIDGSPVQGTEVKGRNGKLVTEFWGIPFAEPPVGNLRFRKPVRVNPWKDVLDASTKPKSCMQTPDTAWGEFKGATMWNPNTDMDEDCLYLNVWVPGKLDPGRKRAVMVWIYGGGFFAGCSTLDVYDGKILASEEEVVLVSMNYRVSLFGFLYLGRPEVPGNMGLWDQLLALKWVKQNIAHFGGDPDLVTIFGESAGGASVSMHLISPHSQPYFKRAITQSGSVTAPWAMEPRELLIKRAVLLCSALKCGNIDYKNDSTWDTDKILKCVMGAPAVQLRDLEWHPVLNMQVPEFADFPWVAVLDGEFFVEDPVLSVQNANYKQTEILVGSNLNEANYFIVYQFSDIFNSETMFSTQEHITKEAMWYYMANKLLPKKYKDNSMVRKAVFQEYRDWDLPPNVRRRQDLLDAMMGDYLFVCNVNDLALSYSENGNNVYYYYFTHRATQQLWPEWMGVLHGYEINFVFGEPLNTVDYSYTPAEQDLSRRFMRYWANFARTGNPNRKPDGTYMADMWPVYSRSNQEYLTLAVDSHDVGHGPRRRQCAFWKHYIPNLAKATANLSDAVLRWKHEFDRWQNEYMEDWKIQFEQYKRYQTYRRMDADSCG